MNLIEWRIDRKLILAQNIDLQNHYENPQDKLGGYQDIHIHILLLPVDINIMVNDVRADQGVGIVVTIEVDCIIFSIVADNNPIF